MSPELDALLCQRYPKIFADRHTSIRTSCMAWGFSCDDGWFEVVDAICARLQHMTDNDGASQVVASQVKEKFGSLQFYVQRATKEQFDEIQRIAGRSNRICEVCGASGSRVVAGGWQQVRCAEHTPEGALSLSEYLAKRKAAYAELDKPEQRGEA
ncbi:MAG: hypothetical protein H6R19_2981 [Proteobacteria bacterium]|nr:hypothetical protein [Pseudomonadota bacterium]